MRQHIILRVVAKVLIPIILLFAFYVQFHGDYGPGGGFQAGVIFAAGVVLYALVFGLSASKRVFPTRAVEIAMALGVIFSNRRIQGSCGGLAALGMEKACDCDKPCERRRQMERAKLRRIEISNVSDSDSVR